VRLLNHAARRAQRGAVLFIALIVLVAMSLAGLALMRGVDTSALIASNLAFKESATAAGDLGVETARSWLIANAGGNLQNDQPSITGGNGYWSTSQDSLDLINAFDWTTAVNVGTDAAGNQVSYVIQRLCDASGPTTSANCLKSSSSTTSASSKGGAAYGTYGIAAPTDVSYRVTVKVTGPRNTVSFVQVTMY
jgi:type IV pilus assembly protein PilX